jgi:hypothetical protein
VQNTSGALNLHFRPGEQVLLFVSCFNKAPLEVTPYYQINSVTNYIAPVLQPLYAYSLPAKWLEYGVTENATLSKIEFSLDM